MGRKNRKNQKKFKKPGFLSLPGLSSALPEEAKKWISGLLILIVALIITLSFFDLAGVAGKVLIKILAFLIGKVVFLLPLFLTLAGLAFFRARYKKIWGLIILAIFALSLGIAGILECLAPNIKEGGYLGYLISWPFLRFFGDLVSKIIFGGLSVGGSLIFWHLLKEPKTKEIPKTKKAEMPVAYPKEKEPSLIRKIFLPTFRVRAVEPKIKETLADGKEPASELRTKEISQPLGVLASEQYKIPPFELLERSSGKPSAGDIITNSAIIKKTLENFGLHVEMSGINVGPTVTQYTLKPAEGIKLSKITALSNNLSLALASHPIRIEAPIPGKSLVGIEVPNKERCQVRLRDLISNAQFQQASSGLTIALGKDVSGDYCYADLAKMPHFLVAGATGTGKTIFLNSLILSLLYQNSPETLRFILIDPKRVEFSTYQDLPHLLTPVIYDAQKTINVLRWLTSEMERRFDVLSGNGSRNISSYNEKILKAGEKSLPYIILIIDELADLMAAKGREMEAGIVRLAQMARAVGIHLVVATQRPSVEVITGLIKANITSRVTFQVASQIDSRTVLDTGGAEKLLGLGDLLFVSAEIVKPKRIQGAFVSEKEVKRIIDYIKSQAVSWKGSLLEDGQGLFENNLAKDLEKGLESGEGGFEQFTREEDSLYQEAKKIVTEAKKASASLLQRRLRVGYARAARLLDILEREGIVGPGEGAKPREVYFPREDNLPPQAADLDEGEGWKKV